MNKTLNRSVDKSPFAAKQMEGDIDFETNCVSDSNSGLTSLNRLCIGLSNSILQFPLIFELQQKLFSMPELIKAEVMEEIEHVTTMGDNFKIVDYGCGTGTYAGLFPRERYIGIDRNQNLVRRASINHPDHDFVLASNINAIQNKLSHLSNILMIGVIHHLSDEAFLSIVESIPKARPVRFLSIDTIKCSNGPGKFIQLFERGEHLRSEKEYLNLLERVADKHSYKRVPYGKFFELAVYRGYIKT